MIELTHWRVSEMPIYLPRIETVTYDTGFFNAG
jgi:hypothetical protein